ncbi:transmembrane protein [Perilla frutescens var. frutescens]|nr:transmembrane protein [Perilla frutescens var. frutescens]
MNQSNHVQNLIPAKMNTMRVELLLHFTPRNVKKPNPGTHTPLIIPIKSKSKPIIPPSSKYYSARMKKHTDIIVTPKSKENSRMVMLVGVSVGVALLLMGFEEQRAVALGPEGPLMEEFWDNMRRYALYALTVSTGAISILLEPIIELLKNPISAILILLILGGGFYLVSQIVTAMVGLSDFSYDYNY